MKKIVYLINVILVAALCSIPLLKATVDDQEEKYHSAAEYLFTQASKGKRFTCCVCQEDCLVKTLSTAKKQKNNTEKQMLISSECLYCAFHTINNTEEVDVLVNNLYKFHTKCLEIIQKNMSSSIKKYSGKKRLYCNECWQKATMSQNQNRNSQSNDDNYTDCDYHCTNLCMPFFLIAQ